RIRDKRASLYLCEGRSSTIPIKFARYAFSQFVRDLGVGWGGGGELQRVSMATTIALPPTVVLNRTVLFRVSLSA
ncbi:hypothetical protein V1478_001799, partial [Vespula squamosa]